MLLTPSFKNGASCDVVKVPSVEVMQPIGVAAHAGKPPPRLAGKIWVPFTTTLAVSSAKTFRIAFVTVPVRVKVAVKVTAVPFGTTIKPGAKMLPVFALETQLEPGRGPAQTELG